MAVLESGLNRLSANTASVGVELYSIKPMYESLHQSQGDTGDDSADGLPDPSHRRPGRADGTARSACLGGGGAGRLALLPASPSTGSGTNGYHGLPQVPASDAARKLSSEDPMPDLVLYECQDLL